MFLLTLLVACQGKVAVTPDTGQGFDVEPISGSLVEDDGPATSVVRTVDYALTGEATLSVTALDGTMTWETIEDDGTTATTLCDAELAISGTAASGYCTDCDFAFDMTSTVTDDGGLEDCDYFPQYTYNDDPIITDPHLVFFSQYGDYYDDLRTGFSVDYTSYDAGYYAGPYYTYVAYEGGAYTAGGTAELADNLDGTQTLTWSWAFTGQETVSNYFNDCGGYVFFDDTSDRAWGGSRDTSSLDCAGEIIDTWQVTLSAGDTFLATVDTVAADSAFDPYLLISGPDTCSLGFADDGFACSHAPLRFGCPSALLEVDTDGVYEVIVGSYGACTGEAADYEIQLGRAVYQ